MRLAYAVAVVVQLAYAVAWNCGQKNGTGQPLELVDWRIDKPANVYMLLRTTNRFVSLVSEDSIPIDEEDVVDLNRGLATAIHLVVRQSAHTNISLPLWRDSLQAQIRHAFVGQGRASPWIRMSVFTGSETLISWTNWTLASECVVPSHWPSPHVDTSCNLYGAMLQGLSVLDHETRTWPFFHLEKILIVWTDDTDRTDRVSQDMVIEALEQQRQIVFLIDVGDHVTSAAHGLRSGLDIVSSPTWFRPQTWDYVLDKILLWSTSKRSETGGSPLLLAYCSPSRHGMHKVRVKDRRSGATVDFTFDADGFGGECNRFDPPWPPSAHTSVADCTKVLVSPLTTGLSQRDWIIGVTCSLVVFAYLSLLLWCVKRP